MMQVVIVGAGISGLACAKTLLKSCSDGDASVDLDIVLVEASNDIGGRIRADYNFIPGHVLDLGAEYIHGRETVLTDWIDEFRREDPVKWNEERWEQIFILSHADGGGRPDSEPTRDGKYGMYYVGNELMMYDDPRVEELSETLEGMLENTSRNCSSTMSVADAIVEDQKRRNSEPLSKEMEALAIATYGNTAGSCDLKRISISTLLTFEHHWEENELEGDYRLPGDIGMRGIIDACYNSIITKPNVRCYLNWQVRSIQDKSAEKCKIMSATDRNEPLEADFVVLTVPPPQWNAIGMELSTEKLDALQFVGFERAMKIVLKFARRLWPEKLQSVICASQPVPEIWFRDIKWECENDNDGQCFLATGFLVSDAADEVAKELEGCANKASRSAIAASIQIKQLSEVLSIPEGIIREAHQDTRVYDWVEDAPFVGGGYMYPQTGMTQEHLKILARQHGRLHFAGEATNTNACCTVQAAIETGVRAAEEIMSSLKNAASVSAVSNSNSSV